MLTVNAVGIFFYKNNKYNFCYIQKQVGGLVMNKNVNYGNWVPEKCWRCAMSLLPYSALPPM